VQALIAKDADVAIVWGGVIEANLARAEVAAHLPTLVFSFYIRSKIRQIEDLRGKVKA